MEFAYGPETMFTQFGLYGMPYNKSTFIAGDSAPSVSFNCSNVRIAYLAFCMVFWLFSIIIICQMAQYSGQPNIAAKARDINNYFGNHTAAFMSGPFILIATILYFQFSRKKLTWFNGVRLDDEPIDVIHYQFKQTIINVPFIYLETAKWLYIVYPATSQDGKKLPDTKIMAKEAALNQIQVELLKGKLKASTATEKSFWFFSKDVLISFIIFFIIIMVAFSG